MNSTAVPGISSSMPASRPNPYVGPGPFSEQDETRFFGRNREESDLQSLVAAHPVVLIYAQSGAGKSSLLQAGLIPKLKKKGYEILIATRFSRTEPVTTVESTIRNIYMFDAMPGIYGEGLREERRLSISIEAALQSRPRGSILTSAGHVRTLHRVLVFDQFEEIFRTHPERWEERRTFFEGLAAALQAEKGLRVVLAMREDFIAHLDSYESILPEGFRTRYRVDMLRPSAALLAVTAPLEKTGIKYADGVAERLVEDLRTIITAETTTSTLTKQLSASSREFRVKEEFIEPVQLQVVCFSLFRNLKENASEITDKDRAAYGNVEVALGDYYEKALIETSLEAGVEIDALRLWFETHLITSEGTRGFVFQGDNDKDVGGLRKGAIAILDQRLHIIRPEERLKKTWYELSHDRFIRPILRANDAWRAGEEAKKRRILAKQAKTAIITARSFAALAIATTLLTGYSGYKTYEARVSDAATRKALSEKESALTREQQATKDKQDFVDKLSVANDHLSGMNVAREKTLKELQSAKDEAQRNLEIANLRTKQAQRAEAKAKSLANDANTAQLNLQDQLKTTKLLTDRLRDSNQKIREQANLAISQTLAATARNERKDNPQRAAWLSIYSAAVAIPGVFGYEVDISSKAVTQPPTSIKITRQSLDALREVLPATMESARHHYNCAIVEVAFSHDATAVTSIDRTGTATTWKVGESTSDISKCADDHPDAVALSSDGVLKAVSQLDQSKTQSLGMIGRNGQIVVSAVVSPGKTRVFPAHWYQVTALAFSPDKKILLVAGGSSRRAAFDIDTSHAYWSSLSEKIGRISFRTLTFLGGRATRRVSRVAFAPDSKAFAVGIEDGEIELWDLDKGKPHLPFLRAQEEAVQGLSFSPDGHLLASASKDNTIALWNVAAKKPPPPRLLSGHTDGVIALAFDPKGNRLASGSQDQTIGLWDLKTSKPLIYLRSEGGYVTSVAYSGDGSQLLSGNSDGTVRVWNMSSLDAVMDLLGKIDKLENQTKFTSGIGLVSRSEILDIINQALENLHATLSPAECVFYFHQFGCPGLPSRSDR